MSNAICTCGGRFLDAEEYRDHMPCPGTALEQEITDLRAQLAAVEKERDEARESLRDLHRRVQRLEGVETRATAVDERIAKLREGMKKDNEARFKEFKRIARAYRDRAREYAALCISFGISDRVDGHEHENCVEGRPDRLIRRLGDALTTERTAREKAQAEAAAMRSLLDVAAEYLRCDNEPPCDDEDEPAPREEWCSFCSLHERIEDALGADAPRPFLALLDAAREALAKWEGAACITSPPCGGCVGCRLRAAVAAIDGEVSK